MAAQPELADTRIIKAVLAKDPDKVKKLLAEGLDPDVFDDEVRCPRCAWLALLARRAGRRYTRLSTLACWIV